MAGRLDQSLPVGNEGAGVVVQAGASPAAQALMGKTVAILGGAMYSQYRCIKAVQCLVLPPGTTPAEGASCFVNPLTALGMVATMRAEGHKALVHTAAASNLGQMLNKICIKDSVGLVNIVRKPEQVDVLKKIGATYVCNSSAPTFMDDLTEALAPPAPPWPSTPSAAEDWRGRSSPPWRRPRTGRRRNTAATGRPPQAGLHLRRPRPRADQFNRTFGMAWGIGGWLLTPFLQKIGFEAAQKLRERVAAEIKTTFASTLHEGDLTRRSAAARGDRRLRQAGDRREVS